MDETQAPKKISPSKLMGRDTSALGQVGQGGISNVGKLAGKVRSNTVRISQNESDIKINVDKLMGVEDEQEQIQETIFNVVDKQGDTQVQVRENSDKIASGMETIAMNLNIIAKELAGTNDILLNQLKNQEKASSQLAQESLKEERDKKEKESESVVKKVSDNIVESVKKPFKSFFDRMVDFFKNIVLGTAVLGILNWLKEPANQQRVENFANFIIDKMPLILTGIAAFLAIGLGVKIFGVITTIIGAIKGLTLALGGVGAGGLIGTLGLLLAAVAAPFGVGLGMRELVEGVFLPFATGVDRDLRADQRADDHKLREYNLNTEGKTVRGGQGRDKFKETNKPLSEEQKKVYAIYLERKEKRQKEQERRDNIKEQKNAELSEAQSVHDKNISDIEEKHTVKSPGMGRGAAARTTLSPEGKELKEAEEVRFAEQKEDIKQKYGGQLAMPKLKMPEIGQDDEMSYSQIETPKFNMSLATGEMTDLPDIGIETPKVPIKGIEMFRGMDKVKSDPAMFSGNKSMLYDIPSPELLNETIVLPPTMGGDKPGNEAAGYSSPGTNLPPIFSAFDANNPSLHAVMSVYNALA